jgi:hypothetical protein
MLISVYLLTVINKEGQTMIKKKKITDYRYELRNMPDENIVILYLLSGNDIVCMSIFHDNDKEVLPPPREGLNGVIYKACRYNWFGNTVDMLRNEGPVYFIWNSVEQIAALTTENENVGEGERQGLIKYIFG